MRFNIIGVEKNNRDVLLETFGGTFTADDGLFDVVLRDVYLQTGTTTVMISDSDGNEFSLYKSEFIQIRII